MTIPSRIENPRQASTPLAIPSVISMASAARATPASGRDVQSALDDALAQVRRAIDAAQVAPRTP